MRALAGWALAAALLVHVGAHLAIVARYAREGRWRRAGLALLVAPLAPYWAFTEGMRQRAWLWAGALLAYALLAVTL